MFRKYTIFVWCLSGGWQFPMTHLIVGEIPLDSIYKGIASYLMVHKSPTNKWYVALVYIILKEKNHCESNLMYLCSRIMNAFHEK